MITQERFTKYVADALRRFYDVAYLQSHPLMDLLCEGTKTSRRAARLREILANAIESTRPAASVPPDRPEWTVYNVLSLSFIACNAPTAVMAQLGVGRTSYYKYRAQGLSAVVALLWTEYSEIARSGLEPAAAHGSAAQEAKRIASTGPRERVNPNSILHQIEQLVMPLAHDCGLVLETHAPKDLPTVYADPAILRQALLELVLLGLRHCVGDVLVLEVAQRPDGIEWRLSPLTSDAAGERTREADSASVAVGRAVLRVYGGRIDYSPGEEGTVALVCSIPTERLPVVLVIDDDDNTTLLYRRYLQDEGYEVSAAHSAQETWSTLSTLVPDLIILDVLMPKQDGWDILQRLREPSTRRIPVLVCSVLKEADLALTLGATAVLQKPFDQGRFVAMVNALLPASLVQRP